MQQQEQLLEVLSQPYNPYYNPIQEKHRVADRAHNLKVVADLMEKLDVNIIELERYLEEEHQTDAEKLRQHRIRRNRVLNAQAIHANNLQKSKAVREANRNAKNTGSS